MEQWEALFDETYAAGETETDQPLSAGTAATRRPRSRKTKCENGLTSTVERLIELKANRVLEIGCGVGLLLQHLAPHAKSIAHRHFRGRDYRASSVGSRLRQQD